MMIFLLPPLSLIPAIILGSDSFVCLFVEWGRTGAFYGHAHHGRSVAEEEEEEEEKK